MGGSRGKWRLTCGILEELMYWAIWGRGNEKRAGGSDVTVQLWLRHKTKWKPSCGCFTPAAGEPLTAAQLNSLQLTCMCLCPHVCICFLFMNACLHYCAPNFEIWVFSIRDWHKWPFWASTSEHGRLNPLLPYLIITVHMFLLRHALCI